MAQFCYNITFELGEYQVVVLKHKKPAVIHTPGLSNAAMQP